MAEPGTQIGPPIVWNLTAAAAACQLTYLLTSFFDVRGNWSERVQMCRHAVGAARRLGDHAIEAEMHRALGVAYRVTHQLGQALDSQHRALELLRALGDERGLAYVYNNIGGVAVELRRFGEAVEAYEMSLRLHTSCGNRAGVATAASMPPPAAASCFVHWWISSPFCG